jgi:RimJ/RimL family protein N-acetyltransferase
VCHSRRADAADRRDVAAYDLPMLSLRPLRRCQLPLTERWFADADTQRWLGGPGWPGLVLDLQERPLEEYRGAAETGRYRWLAWEDDTAVGYAGCDTYDRCTTWDGSPGGRGVVKAVPVPTANISYVVDPALRRQGYGTSVIAALLAHPQLAHVSLFIAGVEPANTGSVACLLRNGFKPLDPTPDWEGMVYYARMIG